MRIGGWGGVVAALIVVISPSCRRAAWGPGFVAEEEAGQDAPPPMAALIDEVIRSTDPRLSFLSDRPDERLAAFERGLEAARTPQEEFLGRGSFGRELLFVGRVERALEVFEDLRARFVGRIPPTTEASLRLLIALSYLRQAEQQNCAHESNPRACLLPIRGTGIHRDKDAARHAAAELEQLLALTPRDISARWLLNLARMSEGTYPESVPETLRLSLEMFDEAVAEQEFPNVAAQLGVDVLGLSGGDVLDDIDGDGWLDIVATSWGPRDPIRVFLNQGGKGFAAAPHDPGLDGLTGGLNVIHADYDNDGDADLFVLRGAWLGEQGLYPNSLLRNTGQGRFEDVTREAGVLSFHPTQTAAWADFDNDGHLDLFVGNESSRDHAHPCELFRNNGDGTFSEIAASVGLAVVGYVKSVAWGDYDNDGLQDLYISRYQQGNLLFHNDGGGTGGSWSFSDRTERAGVAEPMGSFPSWFWDYDNDGWLDLLVLPFPGFTAQSQAKVIAEYLGARTDLETSRLYRNRGDGTFEDRTAASGLDEGILAMGANFGDLDNDGYLDFYVGTGEPNLATLVPNRMYRGSAEGVFRRISVSGGFAHLQKGHGVAWGDIDNDGDQDIYAVMGGAYIADVAFNALFRNPGNHNRWLTLSLRGEPANRDAIGARIHVVTRTPSGTRDVFAVVGAAGSFGSSSLRQELGLGDSLEIVSVEILWPGDAAPRTVAGLELDTAYEIRQNEAPIVIGGGAGGDSPSAGG